MKRPEELLPVLLDAPTQIHREKIGIQRVLLTAIYQLWQLPIAIRRCERDVVLPCASAILHSGSVSRVQTVIDTTPFKVHFL